MSKDNIMYAVDNSFKSNWRLSNSTIRWVLKKGLAPVVALHNAERLAEISSTGVSASVISGLEKGMEVFGFNPKADATSHLEREYSAPSGVEREDW